MNHKTIEPGPSLEGFFIYLSDSSGDFLIILTLGVIITALWAKWGAKYL